MKSVLSKCSKTLIFFNGMKSKNQWTFGLRKHKWIDTWIINVLAETENDDFVDEGDVLCDYKEKQESKIIELISDKE